MQTDLRTLLIWLLVRQCHMGNQMLCNCSECAEHKQTWLIPFCKYCQIKQNVQHFITNILVRALSTCDFKCMYASTYFRDWYEHLLIAFHCSTDCFLLLHRRTKLQKLWQVLFSLINHLKFQSTRFVLEEFVEVIHHIFLNFDKSVSQIDCLSSSY